MVTSSCVHQVLWVKNEKMYVPARLGLYITDCSLGVCQIQLEMASLNISWTVMDGIYRNCNVALADKNLQVRNEGEKIVNKNISFI